MISLEHGGPAFPIADTFIWKGDSILSHHPGMTLRDYFAAQVAPGCCEANPDPVLAAKQSYLIADAMLAARNIPPSAEVESSPRGSSVATSANSSDEERKQTDP